MQNKHYLVVTDENESGEAIIKAASYLNEMKNEYPDTKFTMTGAIHKGTLQWFPATGIEVENQSPFTIEQVQQGIVEVLSTSPFGTTDEDVIASLESRNRPDLKMAAKHMNWLYTTASVTQDNLNIWCDSIFEGDLEEFGITNLTTEYESDPETTYMVEVLSQS